MTVDTGERGGVKKDLAGEGLALLDILRDRLVDVNERLRAALSDQTQRSWKIGEPGTWLLAVGSVEHGWSTVECCHLGDVPAKDRPEVFAEIVSRTGASALMYVFHGYGVWPETEEEWERLMEWRKENEEVENHPDAVPAVISLMWTEFEIVNLALPFEEGEPGLVLCKIVSPGVTPYNEIIRDQATPPAGLA